MNMRWIMIHPIKIDYNTIKSTNLRHIFFIQTQFNIICCKYTHYFRYNKGKVLKMQILFFCKYIHF